MKELNLNHYPKYIEEYKKYFDSFYRISDASWKKLVSNMKLYRVESEKSLLSYQEVEKNARFLSKGIVKCNDTYNEQTFVYDFRVAPIVICQSASILNQTPSHISFETITECDIIVMTQEGIKALTTTVGDISIFTLSQISCYLELIQHKQRLIRLYSAEERYKLFLKSYPSVALNCKQEDIASYINIKQQSLSRIRKNIKWQEDEKEIENLSNEILILENKEKMQVKQNTRLP